MLKVFTTVFAVSGVFTYTPNCHAIMLTSQQRSDNGASNRNVGKTSFLCSCLRRESHYFITSAMVEMMMIMVGSVALAMTPAGMLVLSKRVDPGPGLGSVVHR